MPDSTLDAALVPLMRAPSVRLGHCAICGRPAPLNQHHMVRRGAGALYRGGVEMPKPTDYQTALGMDGWRRVRCRP